MSQLTMDQVVEYIANLKLLEAAELKKALEDKLGVTAAAPMAMMPGMMGQATQEKEEEQTEFTVNLIGYGPKKIQVIKVVRSITSLGLKEAKALVDELPKPLKEGISKEDADKIKEQIEEAGGQVEIK